MPPKEDEKEKVPMLKGPAGEFAVSLCLVFEFRTSRIASRLSSLVSRVSSRAPRRALVDSISATRLAALRAGRVGLGLGFHDWLATRHVQLYGHGYLTRTRLASDCIETWALKLRKQ